jgi:acyl-CoA thioesterase
LTIDALQDAAIFGPGEPASRALGIRIVALARGTCTVTMRVRPDMVNAHGTCHGGVLFTVGDCACGFACNHDAPPTVAAGATIDFLAPAHVDDELTAVATERWQEGRGGVYDVAISNQAGQKIAMLRCRSRQLRGRESSPELP